MNRPALILAVLLALPIAPLSASAAPQLDLKFISLGFDEVSTNWGIIGIGFRRTPGTLLTIDFEPTYLDGAAGLCKLSWIRSNLLRGVCDAMAAGDAPAEVGS